MLHYSSYSDLKSIQFGEDHLCPVVISITTGNGMFFIIKRIPIMRSDITRIMQNGQAAVMKAVRIKETVRTSSETPGKCGFTGKTAKRKIKF